MRPAVALFPSLTKSQLPLCPAGVAGKLLPNASGHKDCHSGEQGWQQLAACPNAQQQGSGATALGAGCRCRPARHPQGSSAPPLPQVRHSNLTASLQQQATLRGLRNEASLMATLNHPNSENLLVWQASLARQAATPAKGSAVLLCTPPLCITPDPPAPRPAHPSHLHPAVCRYLGACADPPLIVME